MYPSNKMHVSDEARAEVSNLNLIEFALIGMGLLIATLSVAIFLTM